MRASYLLFVPTTQTETMTTETYSPFTLDELVAALRSAGLTQYADARSAGYEGHTTYIDGPMRPVFWITPDEIVHVSLRGKPVSIGCHDGEGIEGGWVAGDSPVDTLDEALVELGLAQWLDREMIAEWRSAALEQGDMAMVATASAALRGDEEAKAIVAEAENDHRAQLEDEFFVRVIVP